MPRSGSMSFDRYYAGIILRVFIITLSSLLFAFLCLRTNYLYSMVVMGIVITAETWNLVQFTMRRRNDIKRMLEHIKENNPTIYFSQARVYPFRELADFLNEIGEIVRQVRIDKESNLQYLNFIIQNSETGLLSFDRNGIVEVINQAAKNILGIGEIKSIDQLEIISHGLPDMLRKLRAGDRRVVAIRASGRLIQLSVRASRFRFGHKEVSLLSLQDIKNEMDEKEMDSWQKLIRVLTHEIINSVTPVTSLTSTISGFFRKGDRIVSAGELSDESIREALTGLGYIEERGKNLIDFVNKYRSLTKLPVPRFEELHADDLIRGIVLLKKEELRSSGIILIHIPAVIDIMVYCDRSLTEHVLINLVNNARDALTGRENGEEGVVEIGCNVTPESHAEIFVRDNGPGIPGEILDSIFIPFFTTRESGSGIGLSLSRQIMRLHGGTISVQSADGHGATFRLVFREI